MSFIKRTVAFLFWGIAVSLSNFCYASSEDALFLQNVAKQYMLAQFEDNTNDIKYSVKVGKLDQNRDYGGKCHNYLTAQLQDKQIKKNNIVKITCSRKDNPYTVLIPVNVTVLRPTIIASQNISKGSVITRDLLEKTYINENINTSAAVTNPDLIIGAKSRKDIRAGEQLRQSDFCVVAKGDLVTIEAVSDNLQIKTQGIALEEGKISDVISVRNSKSKKVIQAVVVSANTVRVNF